MTGNPLQVIRHELLALRRQHADLATRIAALESSEKLLAPLYKNLFPQLEDLEDVGITKAIETVLSDAPNIPFAPTTVRDALIARRFQLVGNNPMASIHQILKRLARKWRVAQVLSKSTGRQPIFIARRLKPCRPPGLK